MGKRQHQTASCKRTKSADFLSLHTKIKSKWIKDLSVRPETIKKEILEHRTLFDKLAILF